MKTGYEELLSTLQLSSLSNRRLFLKLCTIFKVLHSVTFECSNNSVMQEPKLRSSGVKRTSENAHRGVNLHPRSVRFIIHAW